jgi:NAD(P)H-hydrate epimerase
MKVVTAEEMRSIDRKTIEEYGIPGLVLMERAGLSVALKVKELFEKKKIIVLAGGGNNGGDGIVAARNLFNWGWNVKILLLSEVDRLSADCLAQYEIARKMGVHIESRSTLNAGDLHSAVVIDAIIGTGLKKPVKSPISALIRSINKSDVPVVSVDMPSGISADNGGVLGEAVQADYTVTFGLPKIGHMLAPGKEYSGRLFIEEIGFPGELLESEALSVQAVHEHDASALLPERPADSYKGDFGHVLVVAGSRGKTGAAFMTARACLRSGAGLVTIGVPETLSGVFQGRITEEMVLPLPDTGKGVLSDKAYSAIADFLDRKADVLAAGPGLTSGSPVAKLIKQLIATVTVPMVLDADALNAISGETGLLDRAKSPVVLTPHIGEMARLLAKKSRKTGLQSVSADLINTIKSDKVGAARSFAKEHGVYLVLKGAPTIIAEPEGEVRINTTGNPGMATAGTGDVLTGMIAALLGQGLQPLDASVLGVYLHGSAGDFAASVKGLHSLVASDIVEQIPSALSALRCREY